MNPKKFLEGLDAAKIGLDSLSGLIVMASLLFVVDAIAPTRLAKSILSEPQAGVLGGLLFIVGSATLGILVDSFFQTFGRWFARRIWKPLDDELNYRDALMKGLGLNPQEFEWVKATGANLTDEVEKKFMRFIEVAGSSAYALLLLSPTTALFLSREYGLPNNAALTVAGVIAAAAVILIFTSASSLAKYEERKTSAAFDEIRKLGSVPRTQKVKRTYLQWKDWQWWVSVACAVLFGGLTFLASWHLTYTAPQQPVEMITISKPTKDGDIQTLQLNVKMEKTPVTPADLASSLLVTLSDQIKTPVNLKLVAKELVQTLALMDKKPEWKVFVDIGSPKGVKEGDPVHINAVLSFAGKKDERIPMDHLFGGNWLLPVIVNDGQKDFLLAYIKVTIDVATQSPLKEEEK